VSVYRLIYGGIILGKLFLEKCPVQLVRRRFQSGKRVEIPARVSAAVCTHSRGKHLPPVWILLLPVGGEKHRQTDRTLVLRILILSQHVLNISYIQSKP